MADNVTTTLSAAVLAGGQSRRMGRDKALIDIDGTPMLARAIATLRLISDDVFVVGNRSEYRQFGTRLFDDAYPGTGTLGGIATAILHARHDYVVVVACDMPLLNPKLLQALADEPRDYDVLVPALANERSSQGGRLTYEALHAIYSKRCLPAIERRLSADQLKVVGFFDEVDVRAVEQTWLEQFDPELSSFLNTNSPSDLNEARSQAAESQKRNGR